MVILVAKVGKVLMDWLSEKVPIEIMKKINNQQLVFGYFLLCNFTIISKEYSAANQEFSITWN